LLLAILACFDQPYSAMTPLQALQSRSAQLLLLLVLGYIALRDHHEERRLIEQAPVSSYHLRPTLPKSVSGALLLLDLKNSERLFNDGRKLGKGGELVDRALSFLWSGVNAGGGQVLRSDGDAILVFFDSSVHANPVKAALEAACEADQRAAEYCAQLNETLKPDTPYVLSFRGGIGQGRIRPIW
jgi:class 3 adenylate cyclase